MKTLLLTCFLFFSVMLVQAQTKDTLTIKEKDYKNEIGVDISPLFNFINSSFGRGGPYYFTYRRNFQHNAVRVGLGGVYTLNNVIETPYSIRKKQIDFRIGYEWQASLAKKWQLFYGCDLLANYYYNREDNISYSSISSTDVYGYKNENYFYGISPLLGIRVNLTSRISISAETSFVFKYYKNSRETFYQISTNLNRKQANSGYQSSFNNLPTIFFIVRF